MIEVVLSGTESETASPTQVPPPFLAIKPPCEITIVLNLHLQGALEWLQLTSPTVSAPLPSIAHLEGSCCLWPLGALPSTRAEDLLGLEGTNSAIPDPKATSSLASPGEVMPEHTPKIFQVSHLPSPPTVLKTPNVASISPGPQS